MGKCSIIERKASSLTRLGIFDDFDQMSINTLCFDFFFNTQFCGFYFGTVEKADKEVDACNIVRTECRGRF